MSKGRHRAGGIVIDQGRVLLMHRQKEGQEYYVIPGGGIEQSETPVDACVREMCEETGLRVDRLRPFEVLNYGDSQQHYFLVEEWEGTPQICGPEKSRQCEENQYTLEWIEINAIHRIRLLPEEIKTAILLHQQR